MSGVTVVWSVIASACFTVAVIYFLVWCRNRSAWSHLLFSLTSASTAAFAFCELWLMRAETIGDLLAAMRWAHVPLFFWLVSTTWFVSLYLGSRRRWLAWTICGLRALYLLLNFVVKQNVNLREVTTLRHIAFLGESVTVPEGVPNPWMLLGHLTMLLLLVFVADAGITAWRRGQRRQAVMVGGGVEFFLLLGLIETVLVFWGRLHMPIVFSLFYLCLVAMMGYELGHDVLRASQLVRQLQASEAGLRESEARMSLAVDAADFGIWIWDLARNEIWASEKWRELFGFAPSENLEFDTILRRLHPGDREALQEAHARVVAGADGGRYRIEYRLTLPDESIRWVSSRGRVECDAAGRAVLIRGASTEVTARKRAELALQILSGRLLSAQEEERHRIARELHDNLNQQMALLAIEIEHAAAQAVRTPASAAPSLRALGKRTSEISTEIHNMSHRLHSAKLEVLGLAAAVRGHCREVGAQGIRVQFSEVGVQGSVPRDVELCLFRIIQEALNNVVKHSGAQDARVTLIGAGDALLVRVSDFGRGFDHTAVAGHDGLGLASMRERLRLVGGQLAIMSRPGQGTTIDARVPLMDAGQPAIVGDVARRTAGSSCLSA